MGGEFDEADALPLGGAHQQEPAQPVKMVVQHRLRHIGAELAQEVDNLRVLIQKPGDVGVAHPTNHPVHIGQGNIRAQRNRSGFHHIAYLTVK